MDCRTKSGRKICAQAAVDITPDQVFLHESYSMSSTEYDIALIKLSRNVQFSGKLKLSPYVLHKF